MAEASVGMVRAHRVMLRRRVQRRLLVVVVLITGIVLRLLSAPVPGAADSEQRPFAMGIECHSGEEQLEALPQPHHMVVVSVVGVVWKERHSLQRFTGDLVARSEEGELNLAMPVAGLMYCSNGL